jgi:hypothetical protein
VQETRAVAMVGTVAVSQVVVEIQDFEKRITITMGFPRGATDHMQNTNTNNFKANGREAGVMAGPLE